MFQRKGQREEDSKEPKESGLVFEEDEEDPCVASKMEVFLAASTSMAAIWNFITRGKREIVSKTVTLRRRCR